MIARRTAGDSRRPTRAPRYPPMKAPPATSPTTFQSMRSQATTMKVTAATALTSVASTFLIAVIRWRLSVMIMLMRPTRRILVGLMSMSITESLQRITAIKNVLATLVNAVAAVTFMVVAWDLIDWKVVGLVAGGAFIGGYLGARVGRRLSPAVLRAIIVVVGVLAIVKIVFFD